MKKPNGKYRFRVEVLKLNEITVSRITKVPAASKVCDQLQNAKLFKAMDLRSEYSRVSIQAEDRDKTVFLVDDKRYCFNRMPCGLTGAPITFRTLVIRLLDGLSNTVVYEDDTVIFSATEAEHVFTLNGY